MTAKQAALVAYITLDALLAGRAGRGRHRDDAYTSRLKRLANTISACPVASGRELTARLAPVLHGGHADVAERRSDMRRDGYSCWVP